MIHLTSLNPDWTPPRLITTSKFLAMSFSGKIEARINLGAGSLFTSETHFKHRALITCQQLRMLIPNNFGLKSSAGNQNLCAAYRPDSEAMSIFLDDFTASCMDSPLLGMEVMVTGYLNADILLGSPCPEGRALMDL